MFKNRLTMRLLLSIFLLRTRDESAKKVVSPLLSTPNCINENENFVGDEYNGGTIFGTIDAPFEVEKRKVEKHRTKYIRGKQRERIDSHERWKFVRWIGTRGRGLWGIFEADRKLERYDSADRGGRKNISHSNGENKQHAYYGRRNGNPRSHGK